MAKSWELAGLYHYLMNHKTGDGKKDKWLSKISVGYHLREKSGWVEDLGSNCSIFWTNIINMV